MYIVNQPLLCERQVIWERERERERETAQKKGGGTYHKLLNVWKLDLSYFIP